MLQYENTAAAVVDTTGNFDVLRLYTLIIAQLSRQPAVQASLRSSLKSKPEATIEDLAASVLDRVKIMRVFDFVGVTEAVGEIRDGIEKKDMDPTSTTKDKKENMHGQESAKGEPPVEKVQMKRTFVADSEDEDDDEDMLFDSDVAITTTVQPVQDPQPVQTKAPEASHAEAERCNVKLILIDNLAQVLNPLLKKEYIKGTSSYIPISTKHEHKLTVPQQTL